MTTASCAARKMLNLDTKWLSIFFLTYKQVRKMPSTVLLEILGASIIALSCFCACLRAGCCCNNRRPDPPTEDIETGEVEDDPLLVDEEIAVSDQECTICIEGYEYGQQIYVMPCGHFYHIDCFRGWDNHDTAKTTSCPNCRSTGVKA